MASNHNGNKMATKAKAGSKNHTPVASMEYNESLVEHASTGTVVSQFTAFDIDGDSVSIKLLDSADGIFRLEGNNLIVADGARLAAKDYVVKIQLRDSHGAVWTGEFGFEVQSFESYHRFDHGPFGLTISGLDAPLYQHAADGTVVGDFHAYNNDLVSMTYELVDDAGGRFKLVDNKLVVADGSKLAASGYTVTVKVTDANGAATQGEFWIEAQIPGKTVRGGAGDNNLTGTRGNDKLLGGLGNDRLVGSLGKDVFDKIIDFVAKDDSIQLENAIFKKVGTKTGLLSKAFFKIGDKAKDANDYLVYNNKTGALSYDADGSGKAAAVKFAQMQKGLYLSHADFVII
jgi:hypothetical protein